MLHHYPQCPVAVLCATCCSCCRMVCEHCAGLLSALETELTRNSLAITISDNAVCSHCSVHQLCFHSTSLHGPVLKVVTKALSGWWASVASLIKSIKFRMGEVMSFVQNHKKEKNSVSRLSVGLEHWKCLLPGLCLFSIFDNVVNKKSLCQSTDLLRATQMAKGRQ